MSSDVGERLAHDAVRRAIDRRVRDRQRARLDRERDPRPTGGHRLDEASELAEPWFGRRAGRPGAAQRHEHPPEVSVGRSSRRLDPLEGRCGLERPCVQDTAGSGRLDADHGDLARHRVVQLPGELEALLDELPVCPLRSDAAPPSQDPDDGPEPDGEAGCTEQALRPEAPLAHRHDEHEETGGDARPNLERRGPPCPQVAQCRCRAHDS